MELSVQKVFVEGREERQSAHSCFSEASTTPTLWGKVCPLSWRCRPVLGSSGVGSHGVAVKMGVVWQS